MECTPPALTPCIQKSGFLSETALVFFGSVELDREVVLRKKFACCENSCSADYSVLVYLEDVALTVSFIAVVVVAGDRREVDRLE